MITARFKHASFAIVAFTIGLSLAIAQDNPPIVESEVIGSVPFQAKSNRLIASDSKTALLVPLRPAIVPIVSPTAAVMNANAPTMTKIILADRPQPDDGLHTILGDEPTPQRETLKSATTSNPLSGLFGPAVGHWMTALLADGQAPIPPPISVPGNARPTPLSQRDSEIFTPSTASLAESGTAANWDSVSRLSASNAPRMPKSAKIFSFDTTDKMTNNQVAPALGQFKPELTLDLAGPDSVAVNQVFQQLVQVRNASHLPLHDLCVTQVCDLSILGADQHQTVTIDCLEAGETKTVRFSARARQVGAFAVRYVAENSRIQADIDDLVEISDLGISVAIAGPTVIQAGDGAEVTITIQNPTLLELTDVCIHCHAPISTQIQMLEPDVPVIAGDSPHLIRLPRLSPQSTQTVRMRVMTTRLGPLNLEIAVDSKSCLLASKLLPITVVSVPR